MRAWRTYGPTLALLLLVGPVAEPPASGDSDALTGLDERWAGARCRIRLSVLIKKGRDREGWSQSIWIVPRTEGAGLGGARLSVSDRDTATTMIPASTTPEGFRLKGGSGVLRGTSFIAEGWDYEDPHKQSGLVLNLRFLRSPARARMVFRGARGGKLNRGAIESAERWARIELFELRAADEVLVDVPLTEAVAPVSQEPQSPPVGVLPERPPPLSDRATVELRVLGVAAEPLRVAPGGEMTLVITYSVSGVPAAQAVGVLERRQILHGSELLTTLEARISRQPGTHESRQPLQVPMGLAAGIYEVRTTVEGLGATADGSAIFQVIADN